MKTRNFERTGNENKPLGSEYTYGERVKIKLQPKEVFVEEFKTSN